MIFRDPYDACMAGGCLLAASGVLLLGFRFWWPLTLYAIDYWTGR